MGSYYVDITILNREQKLHVNMNSSQSLWNGGKVKNKL